MSLLRKPNRWFEFLGRPRLTFALVAWAVLGGAALWAQSPEETESAAVPASDEAAEAAPGVAGLRVFIDPDSGEIVAPTAEQAAELDRARRGDLDNALRTDDEGLVVEASPVEGGGEYVYLEGRFQNAVYASVDAQGKVTLGHVPPPPAEDAEASSADDQEEKR